MLHRSAWSGWHNGDFFNEICQLKATGGSCQEAKQRPLRSINSDLLLGFAAARALRSRLTAEHQAKAAIWRTALDRWRAQTPHCGRNAIAPRPQAKFLGAETPLYLVEIAAERRARAHMLAA